MKLKRVTGALLATMVAASSLVGCGSSATDTSSTSSDAATGEASAADAGTKTGPNGEKLAADQVARGRYFDVITFDSAQVQDSESGSFFLATSEGLFRENNGELENAGCESYDVSEDGLEYTFHLRKNKWSDGKEVVASQYKDAVQRVLNPDLGCAYAFFTFPIKNAEKCYNGECSFDEVGIEAVDDYTLKMTLEAPEPYFVQKLSYTIFCPIRTDIIDQYGDTYGTDATQVLSCGPFQVKEYTANQSLVLEKNPNYWDADNVYLNEVDLQKVDETATQFQMFEAGEWDSVSAISDYLAKWDELANQGQCQLYTRTAPTTQYVEFNVGNNCPSGVVQNAKVRKAIAYALDNQAFLDSVYSGRYTPAYGFVPPIIVSGEKNFRDAVPEPVKEEYDEYVNNPEKLQALLHEGLKELGKDTDDLSTIHIQYLGYGETTIEKDAEQYFVQRLQDNLGVTVDLNIVGDFGLAQAAEKAGEFDIVDLVWGADYNDPMTFIDIFRTDGGSNYGKYSNPAYDGLLDQLATEQDNDKRIDLYKQAETLLLKDDVAIKPLMYRDMHYYISNRLQNLQFPVFGGLFDYRYAYIVEE